MKTIFLDHIRPFWRGNFDLALSYSKNELVKHKERLYIATKAVSGKEPGATDVVEWEVLVEGASVLTTAGDLLTHDGNDYICLPAGEEGQFLGVSNNTLSWVGDPASVLPPPPPPPTPDLSKLVDLTANIMRAGSACFRSYLMQDGSAKSTGSGEGFRNGDSQGRSQNLPEVVAVEGNITFEKLYSGTNFSYGIAENGDVFSWGKNTSGQLGHGNTTNIATAKKIAYFANNNIKIDKIFISGFGYGLDIHATYFLTRDKHLYAVGNNNDGNLGNGTSINQTTPVRCGSLVNIEDVSVSSRPFSVYVIDSAGDLWAWGNNSQFQLGFGTNTKVETPTKVTAISSIKKVIVACANTMSDTSSNGLINTSNYRCFGTVLLTTGAIYSIGSNNKGQLGVGDKVNKTTFSKIDSTESFKDIFSSDGDYGSVAAVTLTNELYVWGANNVGQLGLADTSDRDVPTKIEGVFSGAIEKVDWGGSGSTIGLVVQVGNALYATGYNENGNLALGISTNVSNFLSVPGISGVIKSWELYGTNDKWGISLVLSDGRAYAAGSNQNGETGTQADNLTTELSLTRIFF